MNPARKAVLIDIAYEIGGAGLAGFHHFLTAFRAGQWATAAAELKNSRLYQQVPKREQENMMILATGEFPPGITSAVGLVQHHEGCTLTAKPDAKGKWAYGWGHDIPAPMPGEPAPTCTQAEADTLLAEDFGLATLRAREDLGPEHWNEDPTA